MGEATNLLHSQQVELLYGDGPDESSIDRRPGCYGGCTLKRVGERVDASLLQLLPPKSGNDTESVRCLLTKINIVSAHNKIDAYFWGNLSLTKSTNVNGFSLEVTQNLYHFLRQILR